MSKKDQEITLKDLLLKLKEWKRYLQTKWILLLVVAILGCITGYMYANNSKPVYKADMTFVLSNSNQSGKLAGLAGQFGLDLGTSNDDVFSGDNIVELLKSQKIVKRALFRQIPSTKETLINLILDKENIRQEWEKNPYLKAAIPFPNNANSLSPLQDSLFAVIYKATSSYLKIGKKDKNLSFYQVSAESTDETVSYYFVKYLVDESANFYIETKTKSAKQNLDMLSKEADSLRNLLGGAITATAKASDETFNLNPAYQVERAASQQNQVKTNILGSAYGEVVKNLELAKITLQRETPLYQIIDEPFLPLLKIKLSKLKSMLLLSFILTFFTALILLLRLTLKHILASTNTIE
jgi:hypothetical protein